MSLNYKKKQAQKWLRPYASSGLDSELSQSGSGSDKKSPEPARSGSDTLTHTNANKHIHQKRIFEKGSRRRKVYCSMLKISTYMTYLLGQ